MVVPCEENPLPVSEVEIDEFQFHYTASEKPHIQNVRALFPFPVPVETPPPPQAPAWLVPAHAA